MKAHKRGSNYKPTTTITLEEQLLNMIDDYRFDSRKDNRSQAIAELIKLGFEHLQREQRVPS